MTLGCITLMHHLLLMVSSAACGLILMICRSMTIRIAW